MAGHISPYGTHLAPGPHNYPQATHSGRVVRTAEPKRLFPMFLDTQPGTQFPHATSATDFLKQYRGQLPPDIQAHITSTDYPCPDDEILIIHDFQVPSNAPPHPALFPGNSPYLVPSSRTRTHHEIEPRAYPSTRHATEEPAMIHSLQIPSSAPALAAHDRANSRRPNQTSHSSPSPTGHHSTRRVEERPMVYPPSPALTEPRRGDRTHSEQLRAFSFEPIRSPYPEKTPSPLAPPYLSYPTPSSPGYPASPLTPYNAISPGPRHISPPETPLQTPSRIEGSAHGRGDSATGRRVSVSRPAPYHRRQSSGHNVHEGTTQRRQSVSENTSLKRSAPGPNVRVSRKVHGTDWSGYRPGQSHTIISNLALCKFTSHASIEDFEEIGVKAELVTYAPRRPEFSSADHNRTVDFSVRGMPGPSLSSIMKKSVELDGDGDRVFEETKWRSTKVFFDWPGIDSRNEGIDAGCTRGELASLIANMIFRDVKAVSSGRKVQEHVRDVRWDLRTLRLSRLRLVSLNYYKNVWVPVLAYYDYDL